MQEITRKAEKRFNFLLTIFISLICIPLSYLSLVVAGYVFKLWAFINGFRADDENLFILNRWFMNYALKHIFDFVSVAVGLLFLFWLLIKFRNATGWRISVSSVVMIVCFVWIVIAILGFAVIYFQVSRALELGILDCDIWSIDLFRCELTEIGITPPAVMLNNLLAICAAGKVYSSHLDDTDSWAESLSEKSTVMKMSK